MVSRQKSRHWAGGLPEFINDILIDGQVSRSECQSYLGPSMFDLTTKSYIVNFSARDFIFPEPASHHYDKTVIRRINFQIVLKDQFYPPGGDAQMSAHLFDAESQAVSPNGLKYSEAEINSTVYSNFYTLGKSQHNVFKIERTIRKFIIPSLQNVLIGRPNFVTLPMLSSTYASFPLVGVSNNIYARASVEPSSYIVNTEIEKSDLTLLDVLSALGGMYSLIMAFYVILYGDKSIEPWGLIQKLRAKSVRNELEDKKGKHIDMTEWIKPPQGEKTATSRSNVADSASEDIESSPGESTVSVAIDEKTKIEVDPMEELKSKVAILEKRQQALENFLQNYVVSMSFYTEKDNRTKCF
ncbi:6127_t:CDS:2 [Paraglomus occultum]|uniref:6127_t:CDS:1 n=1 Tax=Paraglomus occultum TaxID=144539 RepID=A0A9N9BQ90_9GLOM|nr:6127_t:CDS:2 [Paraglomus occultum]